MSGFKMIFKRVIKLRDSEGIVLYALHVGLNLLPLNTLFFVALFPTMPQPCKDTTGLYVPYVLS